MKIYKTLLSRLTFITLIISLPGLATSAEVFRATAKSPANMERSKAYTVARIKASGMLLEQARGSVVRKNTLLLQKSDRASTESEQFQENAQVSIQSSTSGFVDAKIVSEDFIPSEDDEGVGQAIVTMEWQPFKD